MWLEVWREKEGNEVRRVGLGYGSGASSLRVDLRTQFSKMLLVKCLIVSASWSSEYKIVYSKPAVPSAS